MQDKIMLFISVMVFVIMVLAFTDQIAIDKKYEKCMDESISECIRGKLLTSEQCNTLATNKCEGEMQ